MKAVKEKSVYHKIISILRTKLGDSKQRMMKMVAKINLKYGYSA